MAKEITSIKEQKKIIMGIIEPCRRPYKRKSVSILELMKESMKRGIPAFDTMAAIVKLMKQGDIYLMDDIVVSSSFSLWKLKGKEQEKAIHDVEIEMRKCQAERGLSRMQINHKVQ